MSELTEEKMISITKVMLWEQAKGNLRALVAVAGQATAKYKQGTGEHIPGKFDEVERAVEDFIEEFEGLGLPE